MYVGLTSHYPKFHTKEGKTFSFRGELCCNNPLWLLPKDGLKAINQ